MLSGILLGKESGIPTELLEAYNRTGTTHIIAISGFKYVGLEMICPWSIGLDVFTLREISYENTNSHG